jgi:hypothetical protein
LKDFLESMNEALSVAVSIRIQQIAMDRLIAIQSNDKTLGPTVAGRDLEAKVP